MKFTCVIDGRGRITIPSEIRRRSGLAAGDQVHFVVKNRLIILQPAHSANFFEKFNGVLGRFPGDEKKIKAWVRQMRDD